MLRFRIALMILMVGLTLLTVSTVGVSAYRNSRAAAHELSNQVLEQVSWRIDQEVQKLLEYATDCCDVARRRINPDDLDAKRFPETIGFWRDLLAARPELTSIFIGVEATGESIGVSRLNKGRLSVWQSRQDPATKTRTYQEYWAGDYPAKPFKPPAAAGDARTRPWFIDAREARRLVWTDSYEFIGVEGVRKVRGVTCAVPCYGADGSLKAVLTVDFDLGSINRFLGKVTIGRDGSAFLVEQPEANDFRLIAHRSPEIAEQARRRVLADAASPPSMDAREVNRIRACLGKLPALPLEELPPSTVMRFHSDGANYLGASRRVQGAKTPQWLICVFMPEAEVLAYANHTIRMTLFATTAVLVLAVALSMSLARQVARPLERMADEAIAVGSLRLESRPRVRSFVLEVDRLANAGEEMKAGLRSFQKYLPVKLVRNLLESGQEATLGGEKRVMTVMFTDIAGFTPIAESMPVEELVSHLGDYLGALSETISDSGGTVDKFIGDAVMAFWGAPAWTESHAADACLAAIRCRRRLHELQSEWVASGRPAFRTRFGLHTGEVIVGNIGSPNRMNYTVIGDAANLANRLEGLSRHYGTEIIISEQTFRAAAGAVVCRPLDVAAVVGRVEPVPIFEVLGTPEEVGPETMALAEHYAEALAAFRSRRWPEALEILDDLLRRHPEDGPSNALAARCRRFLESPPDDAWDGVNRLAGK